MPSVHMPPKVEPFLTVLSSLQVTTRLLRPVGVLEKCRGKHFIEAFESILQNAYKFNISYRSNMAQNKTVSVGQL